jgi:hypothetical protein
MNAPGKPAAAPLPLGYGPAAALASRVTARRVALACGGVPLVTGVLVLLAWLVTGQVWLVIAGLLTIVVGCVLVAVGSIAAAIHAVRNLRAGHLPRRRVLRDAGLIVVLLLSNFPAALVCAGIARRVDLLYVVTVVNASGVTLDSFVISGPGVIADLGPVGPGARASHACRFADDGELTFAASQPGSSFSGTIDGYVYSISGGDEVVTVAGPGAVIVTPNNRPPLLKWMDN